ncbi:MAG: hypothetical protein GY750_15915, partial [Lentisphaerae bacterium]|nr:hypothetical protein [Lentisphaerota bacterium]
MASLAIAAAFSGTFSAAGLGISALGMSGAAVGWAVGSAVATVLLRPEVPDQEGPRLSDLSVQSSAYGSPLPKYYGDKSRGAGELIWSSGLDEKTHEEDIGGKGGGGTATTYSYSSSFAISIGEGPIAGVRRIWANGKLIFTGDPSADPADLVASRKVSAGLTIYNGTDTQEPDPTIEAYEGETPAYRGTAYVVFTDLDLTNYGNRIPNITFGVVPVGSLVEPGRIKQTKPAAINYSGMVITSVEDGVVRVLDLDNDII